MRHPSRKVKHLSSKFGIKIVKMNQVHKGVYRVVSAKGKHYCLKRMLYPTVRIRWIDKTLEKLKQSGFKRIAWRDRNRRSGKLLYVKRTPGSPPYLLTPWVEGRWPSPESKQDMRDCGVFLAEFHIAGRKVATPKKGRLNMIGKWPGVFSHQFGTIRRKIFKARKNKFRRPLDRLLQEYGGEIMSRAREALHILKNSKYREACRKAGKTGSLVHGDGGPTNFIVTPKGLYLIDFETLRHDLRAYDLYRILHNSCKDHNWDFEIAKAILDGYQSVSKLNSTDFELMKVWLRFPRGIFKLLARYERSGNKSALERQLRDLIAEDRKKDAFLEQLDRYGRGE